MEQALFKLIENKTDISVFKVLIESNTKININTIVNTDKQTLLIAASKAGNTALVGLLLEQEGIDINAKDNGDTTALIFASYWGYKDVVKLLLEQPGIDINAQDNGGSTALIWATRKGYKDIVKIIENALNSSNVAESLQNKK